MSGVSWVGIAQERINEEAEEEKAACRGYVHTPPSPHPMGEPVANLEGVLLAGLIAAPLLLAAAYPLFAGLREASLPAIFLTLFEGVGFIALYSSGDASLRLPWLPPEFSLAFRLDGLAFLFSMLVTWIGVAVLIFSSTYVPHDFEKQSSDRRLTTYYAFLLAFMGSMLGLVCADDLLTLYVFWEATTVSSFLLIGIHIHQRESRRSALQSFLLTGGAGLFLLVGFLGLALAAGTGSIPDLLPQTTTAQSLSPWIGLCLLVGVAAKSAQLPLHPWLPSAMVAPTPVSAYLHSATMVAAGVFLLARLGPLVSALPVLPTLLVVMGSATMILGGLIACRKSRLKEILAWSTISQYGYVTLLLGLGAWGAACFYMASHAVLKAGLFLSAGAITHSTGEDDVDQLGGLWKTHPVTASTTFVLALGLAGLPATSGFWMKEFLYKEVVSTGQPWVEAGSLVAGILTLTYMLRYAGRIFFGPRPTAITLPDVHGVDRWKLYGRLSPLLVPTFLLASLAVAAGLLPSLGLGLTDPAASAAAGRPIHTEATLHWPPDRALWLTLATYVLGTALAFWLLTRDRRLGYLLPSPLPGQAIPAYSPAMLLGTLLRNVGASSLYHHTALGTESVGKMLSRIQTGRLLDYLLCLVAIPVLLGVSLLPRVETWSPPLLVPVSQQATLAFAALSLSAVGLGIASAVVRSHVASILLVGGVGFLLSLVYALLRAPDVALVQVTVETVSALLLFLALGQLPFPLREQAFFRLERRTTGTHLVSILVSIALAATVSTAVLAISPSLGDPLLARSYFGLTRAEGATSVVSTILTDFRSMDTLGEISVFATAAIGTVLLLGRRRGGRSRNGQAP